MTAATRRPFVCRMVSSHLHLIRGFNELGKFTIRLGGNRFRPGRLCRGDPRKPAQDAGRGGRARGAGRRLPELGMHPVQGAAEFGRNDGIDSRRRQGARNRGRRSEGRFHSRHQAQPRGGRQALQGRALPVAQEQDRSVRGQCDDRGTATASRSRRPPANRRRPRRRSKPSASWSPPARASGCSAG